ncbi:MAG: hypothetical protein ACRECX_01640 [Methyloceanibacter sp.]|uniref:hypothetical protein n=1 Tax=Methyloceanibacter sp. TaxID=1965321 RepID=UPI003D6DA4DA
MPIRLLSSVFLAVGLTALSYPAAADYSAAVKGACKGDYKRFCGVYAVSDPGLRKCMDQAGQSLSLKCVKTLVDSGEVTKARAVQRWKQPIN